jgi:hypothetical protein
MEPVPGGLCANGIDGIHRDSTLNIASSGGSARGRGRVIARLIAVPIVCEILNGGDSHLSEPVPVGVMCQRS